MLHLVNYDEEHPVERVEIRLQLQSERRATVTVLSPDSGGSQTLAAEQRGAELRFTLPRLEVYSLVVIE